MLKKGWCEKEYGLCKGAGRLVERRREVGGIKKRDWRNRDGGLFKE
jgi:hypothetical protein